MTPIATVYCSAERKVRQLRSFLNVIQDSWQRRYIAPAAAAWPYAQIYMFDSDRANDTIVTWPRLGMHAILRWRCFARWDDLLTVHQIVKNNHSLAQNQ